MSSSLQPHGLYSPWNSPGRNTGVGSFTLFQGIYPTQGLNPGLSHCRQILYWLSHQGSPHLQRETLINIGLGLSNKQRQHRFEYNILRNYFLRFIPE